MNCFKFITILFSFSIQNLALSQTTTITVSGVIKDSTQRNPLAFATVSLLHKKSQPDTLFKTAYSNKKGEFQFTQVDTGAYLVTASYAGYKQYQREFRIDKEMDSVLPDILLGSLINTLTTVVVTAKKPLIQQEGDKLIFNVEDDPDSKGQATIDVFRKLPFVTVDRENNIRLNGQTNFKVLLNGRETSLFARNLKEALKGFRVH